MKSYTLSHLADHTLLRDLATLVARDRALTADLLAHLAEVDARRLYLPVAHPSMFSYCVHELRMSEDCAFKRIKAARAARRFPAIFGAVADGRLHLSAVVLLAPHLSEDTADELLAAARYKSKSEIELLLAERFPRPEVLAWVEGIPGSSAEQQAPGPVEDRAVPGQVGDPPVPEPVVLPQAPGPVRPLSRVTPLTAQSFAVQFTLSRSAHEKLCYAQELLGHRIPSGDMGAVFERALDALIGQLERRKLAATLRPRRSGRPSTDPRHIPAHVRRTVWGRDGGQCTFTSEAGHRCPARTRLEYDHVDPVARGGQATVSEIRLRCRAHNEEGSSRRWRSAHELSRAGTWERHAGKNALN